MKILASASALASALTSALQKLYFRLNKITLEEQVLYVLSLFIFFQNLFATSTDFFKNITFIHPNAPIGVLEKSYLNFRKHPPVGGSKK